MEGLHPWWPAAIPVHPHFLFEALGYLLAGVVGFGFRARYGDRSGNLEQRIWVLVGAMVGGTIGAKLLFLATDPVQTLGAVAQSPLALIPGKTIVGGLLGGLIGVELAKKFVGVTRSTGDLFVPGLVVGMFTGRLGCFFSGVKDGTHGVPWDGPFAMDLGDGILRHPTMLYELVWLGLLGSGLAMVWRWDWRPGERFRLYLSGYLLFRLAAESLKTQPALVLGLSAIQLACLAGLAYDAWYWSRRTRGHRA